MRYEISPADNAEPPQDHVRHALVASRKTQKNEMLAILERKRPGTSRMFKNTETLGDGEVRLLILQLRLQQADNSGRTFEKEAQRERAFERRGFEEMQLHDLWLRVFEQDQSRPACT